MKYFLFFVLLFILSIQGQEIVTIPDENLKSLLKETLNIEGREINTDDMALLTELYGEGKNISDLTGLEYAVNLVTLSLYQNQISRLNPLSDLRKISYLHLNENSITDIQPLSGITSLRTLLLADNPITDISPLENLNRLSNLSLANNQITDISAISSLDSLSRVDLSYNQINDISALSDKFQLSELSLYENQVSDLSPLSSNIALVKLNLDYNRFINDLSPLRDLSQMENLSLSVNQITDISYLSRMTGLKSLGLSDNLIEDISPLAGMNELTYLSMGGNKISDGTVFNQLTQLNYLILYKNALSNVDFLSDLTNLVYCEIHGNRITSLPDLSGLNQLEELNFSYNLIEDISGISQLTNLQKLICNNNRIKDCSPCSGLTGLTYLYLENNRLVDISPLSDLNQLTSLYIAYNFISELLPIRGAANLINLSLNSNRLNDSDLANLLFLNNLTNEEIYFEEFGDFGYLDLRENLGFSETSIKLLANRLEHFDFEHILWDEMSRILFTEFPRAIGITDKNASLVWAFNGEAVCSVFVFEKEENSRIIRKYETPFDRTHKIELNGLTAGADYNYIIKYFSQDFKELGVTRILEFKTLDDYIDKKIQLCGKPQIITLTHETAVIEVFTDYPLPNIVCSLYNQTGPVVTLKDQEKSQSHRFEFEGLTPGTGYGYQIGIELFSGTVYVPIRFVFRTKREADIFPPVIMEGPFEKADTSSVFIFFKTDEGTICELEVLETESGNIIERLVSDNYQFKHFFFINNLNPNTLYEYSLSLKDRSGNTVKWNGSPSVLEMFRLSKKTGSSGNQFSTSEESDTLSPYFTEQPNLIACYDSLAVIQWSSNEPCRFALKVFDENYHLVESVEQSEYTSDFNAYLTRLRPSTSYSVHIMNTDLLGNEKKDTNSLMFVTHDKRFSVPAELTAPLAVSGNENFLLLNWKTDIPCDSRMILDHRLPADNGVYLYDGILTSNHLLIYSQPVDSSLYGKYLSYDLIERPVFESVPGLIFDKENIHNDTVFSLLEEPVVVYSNNEIIFLQWETNLFGVFSVEYYPLDAPGLVMTAESGELAKKQNLKLFELDSGREYRLKLELMTIEGELIIRELTVKTKEADEQDTEPPLFSDTLMMTIDSSGAVVLKWSDSPSPDLNYYQLYKRQNDSIILESSSLKLNKWICSSDDNETSWGLKAVDYNGNFSEIQWFVPSVEVFEPELSNKEYFHVSLYPNPADKKLFFSVLSGQTRMVNLKIYNILGEKIFKENFIVSGGMKGEFQIDLQNWRSGIYLYSIESDGEILQKGKGIILK